MVILLPLGAFFYYEAKAGISSWTFLVVIFSVGTALMYWLYKKFYNPNIQTIRESLDEIKDLDTE